MLNLLAAFAQFIWGNIMLAAVQYEIDGFTYVTTSDVADGEVRLIHECLRKGRIVRMCEHFYKHNPYQPMEPGDFVTYLKESKLVK